MTAGETIEAVLKAALHFVQTKKEKKSRAAPLTQAQLRAICVGLDNLFG